MEIGRITFTHDVEPAEGRQDSRDGCPYKVLDLGVYGLSIEVPRGSQLYSCVIKKISFEIEAERPASASDDGGLIHALQKEAPADTEH